MLPVTVTVRGYPSLYFTNVSKDFNLLMGALFSWEPSQVFTKLDVFFPVNDRYLPENLHKCLKYSQKFSGGLCFHKWLLSSREPSQMVKFFAKLVMGYVSINDCYLPENLHKCLISSTHTKQTVNISTDTRTVSYNIGYISHRQSQRGNAVPWDWAADSPTWLSLTCNELTTSSTLSTSSTASSPRGPIALKIL